MGHVWSLLDRGAVPPPVTDGCLAPRCRMSVPISISNPDLARHSTELFMDSGFSPLSQRLGAMVAFDRFEDFTRWGAGTWLAGQTRVFWVLMQSLGSTRGWKSQSWQQLVFLLQPEAGAGYFQYNRHYGGAMTCLLGPCGA